MHIYLSIYIYIYIMHIYLSIYKYIHIYLSMHLYIYIYIYTRRKDELKSTSCVFFVQKGARFFGPRNLSLRQTKSEFWDLRYTKNIEALLLALPNMCCSYCYKTLVLFAAYLLPCFLAFCAFSFFILYHSTAIVIVVKFC